MTELPFDVAPASHSTPEELPGCRLHRLEVFNWGTFDQRVWTFNIDGRNALLTGDIGSGKSTLVDALTTLLLPANRISYNKAAGADTRERDLRSYVLGHYKSERNEVTGTSRPVGLRDTRHYSVILGVFANTGFGDTVTIAQVFRARDLNQGQPDRFYVVADTELTIAKHFSDFGTELPALRRRLREHGVRVHDSFPDYSKDFRRRLSIESEQAMDLFHQTVSMKAVDNLNDFVRSHMLEPFDTKSRIDALVEHFDHLTKAHDAVVKARAQLELLNPLVEQLDAYDGLTRSIDDFDRVREAIPVYFAHRARTLLADEVMRLTEKLRRLNGQIELEKVEEQRLRDAELALKIEVAGHGGNELTHIENQIAELVRQEPQRRKKFDRFNELLQQAGLDRITVQDQFVATVDRLARRTVELEEARSSNDTQLTDLTHERRVLQDEATAVNDELRSLASRQSNVPRQSLEIRTQLAEDLSVSPDALPFAGELIKVRDDSSEWEGAAERVLRGYALSLLVPDEHYEAVASWINDHHLNARLVYYRVPARTAPRQQISRRTTLPLLVDMLEVKPDTPFSSWVESELDRRADHVCVPNIRELRSVDKAVTRQGQIKDRSRHEKDDRHRIDDRRQYVLGWSNQHKVDALIEHAQHLHDRTSALTAQITNVTSAQRNVEDQRQRIAQLGEYSEWSDLDWADLVRRISALRADEQRLRQSSDQLAALTASLDDIREQLVQTVERREKLIRVQGADRSALESANAQIERLTEVVEGLPVAVLQERAPAVEAMVSDVVAIADISLANFAESERRTTALVNARRMEAETKRQGASSRIVRAMTGFRALYPQETAEFDDSLASAGEYSGLQERVARDDLPRFEREFKDYLNQNTIRDIANLSAQLNKQETIIRERVESINRSLHDIDYNEGRYIRLVPDRTPNTDIREFRQDLLACTSNVVGGTDEQYSEERFLQVRRIIERFKGREGMVDQDRTWTRRVTDVRQWFVFSASERWRDRDAEYENYTDSAGKSGGQKEKLAYTILAASLAYQFKLDREATRTKSFRFVVIDEAFGRGSDDSTRYALSLFTSLGLQLLIVTPLQKIQVIEPHVSAVGFVDNLNGSYSRLQCLSIEEYRLRRDDQVAASRVANSS
ncbi:MAG: AAA family ATPase [Acidimicrobiales bacterium]|nr:AAA family ATPase [Acidimicrobiales bacterium]